MNYRNTESSIVFNDNQFTKRIIFEDEDVLSFVLNLKPGQSLPTHQHENSALTFIVIQGKGEVQVGEEVQKIQKGSAVLAKGKESFGIPSVEEDLSIFVTLTPKPNNTKFAQEIG
ncbi:cupin domain-containing protein [Sedimentibacter sp. B4]|uniref:cupin domain-containing protein n=1 Tax=Sedimentibacter sp. B4 TaxID=304766 RepID=UPI000593904B|nr:cupin domain-containing protein [Sedimentibacter sp. B4]